MGCDRCGEVDEEKLYGWTGRRWVCSGCHSKRAGRRENWIKSDSAFKARWKAGEQITALIAKKLREDGIDVTEPEKSFRKNYSDRRKYRDEVDLYANGMRVEVKSRTINWTTLEDFPYPDIMVDTTKKWDSHKEKPVATINVCKSTGAIIIVPGKSESKWVKRCRTDKDSGFESEFYFAPSEVWVEYEKLVQFLKGRVNGRAEVVHEP
jgi:hypothetical protein